MRRVYLVRHGLMGRVGRFQGESEAFGRGQAVVVQSWRGIELGEILATESSSTADRPDRPATARLLRLADAGDVERARRLDGDRPRLLSTCERILAEGDWPLELIDVEPLMDDRRTVLHYLGPHKVAESLVRALREGAGLDVVLEPAGIDEACEACGPEKSAGGCGEGGCSAGGGCSGGGCSGCGVKDLVGAKRKAVAAG